MSRPAGRFGENDEDLIAFPKPNDEENLLEGPQDTPIAIPVEEDDELDVEDYGYDIATPDDIAGAAHAEPLGEEEIHKDLFGWIFRDRRVTTKIAVLATLAVILGIVLGVVSGPENLSPCDDFYDNQSPQFRQFADVLLAREISTCETVLTPNTPQSDALLWLVRETEEGLVMEEAGIDLAIQRYALAVLYFATSGADWSDMLGFLSGTSVCEWQNATAISGVAACNEEGFVTELLIGGNNLNGTIPSELGALSQLRVVDLGDNLLLSGPIPETIGRIEALERFRASKSNLTGQIPANIGDASNLTIFQVDSNSLFGSIPTEVGSLTLLESWNTQSNLLKGPLPSEMGLMTSLKLLFLKENELSGSIPSSFGALTGLAQVDISANNFKDGATNICVDDISLTFYAADCYDQLVPPIARQIECDCCTECCNEELSGCIEN